MSYGILGTGTYTARVVDRITKNPVPMNPLLKITFSRRRDSPGTGSAQFGAGGDADCCAFMGNIRSWRHELEIHRDPGGLMFVGPITGIEDTRSLFTVTASDRLAWLDYRYPRGVRSITDDPATLLKIVLAAAMSEFDPINIKANIVNTGTIATVSWDFSERKTAAAILQDLFDSELDVTMVGDTLYGGAKTVPEGSRANLTEGDLAIEVTGTEAGKDLATIIHARGANGLVATYPPQNDEDNPVGDLYYGIVEQSVDFSDISDVDELTSAARAWWATHRLPPFRSKIPSGSRLSPDAPIDVGWLIPGAQVNFSTSNIHCRQTSAIYEIDTVDIAAGAGGGGTPRAASGQFVSFADAAGESVQIGLVEATR